jgi:hypothetical protein
VAARSAPINEALDKSATAAALIAAAPYRYRCADSASVSTTARSRNSRTSSSVVWEKSSYQHRHTTARQAEHNDVKAAGVISQLLGEFSTSLGTISEWF